MFLKDLRSRRWNISEEDVILQFLKKLKDAADYVCCSCNRMMYRMSALELKEDAYTKTRPNIVSNVLRFRRTSAQGKEWICRTCHVTLKDGKLPNMSKANNLGLDEIPDVLKDLNPLELRLLSQRIPFMKMIGLPRGKQHGIHGPAVNVPSKLDFVCGQFPRLPSECQLIPMKLKRKLKFSNYYMYDYIRKEKVLAALRWLKINNPLYSKIKINENWTDDAACDDPDLWKAMTDEQVPTNDAVESEDNPLEATTTTGNNPESENAWTVEQLQGMQVVDVPGDGNCMFFAVCLQLKRLGKRDMDCSQLRKELSSFMKAHSAYYKGFVCVNVSGGDTDQPTGCDEILGNMENSEIRQELLWKRYLHDLVHTRQWGENISLQAIYDKFSLRITIH